MIPPKVALQMQIRTFGFIAVLSLATLCMYAQPVVAASPEIRVMRSWINDMKMAHRGPFARLRWFCKDGSILPPKPYDCDSHGGSGEQHGEWSDRTKTMRANGYYIANILADLNVRAFKFKRDHGDAFKQMLIERYLINTDDGWIMRGARYYRGAFQEESERAGAKRLLLQLAEDRRWADQGYVVLRAGAHYLAHGADTSSVSEVRQLSTALASRDTGFAKIRNKIHVQPAGADAKLVRDYMLRRGHAGGDYARLAAAIDGLYKTSSMDRVLGRLLHRISSVSELKSKIEKARFTLNGAADPQTRFAVTAQLLAALRDFMTGVYGARGRELRLALIDASLAVESEHFAASRALGEFIGGSSRRQRIELLEQAADAVYGAGLISARQVDALKASMAQLRVPEVNLETYKKSLDYMALMPTWASQWLRFHYADPMKKLATVEPKSNLFIQDLLRGSPLFFYVAVLDNLVHDANRMAGIRNELFGVNVGTGLRGLNPGLARGRLYLAPPDGEIQDFDKHGIYLLAETVSDLPPVAGILTAGAGNPLSHIQLLARNLGIPNVGVDEALIARLAPYAGQNVVLAVSPKGSVRLSRDDGGSGALFSAQQTGGDVVIRPDLAKLDLNSVDFLTLKQLRAHDSGRTVGPKAAKLGELFHHYPEAVANGLAIPFGYFRRLLGQSMPGTGRSVYDWMVQQYAILRGLPEDARIAATDDFRQRLQDWISHADPGSEFREQLRARLLEVFGEDGSYGVFVRSDTNVEDLPGFTGAGLNLTVPNVVGFENIMQAIPLVWASPFSKRAFGWRQSHMEQPQHVYPAVLLMRSVPVEKSGVMVTRDIDTGDDGWLSVAVNEGVGGAVDGQAAESLRINTQTGKVKLLAQATAIWRRAIDPRGGVRKKPVTGGTRVLNMGEIHQLIDLFVDLPRRFPALTDAQGRAAPADIEFGFLYGGLRLFQIRPFLENESARQSEYLHSMDQRGIDLRDKIVNLMASREF